MELKVPDRDRRLVDVVLGYDTQEDYRADDYFLGSTIGRYAGRIDRGIFELDGQRYRLGLNDGGQHLHGGHQGFNRRLWTLAESGASHVKYRYLSDDGEEGYPGRVAVSVCYTLLDDNALQIDFNATAYDTTVVNLTNHSYFNLDGHTAGDIRRHKLQLLSGKFMPLSATLIPKGPPANVDATPFDFQRLRTIGDALEQKHSQLVLAGGFDHGWLLPGGRSQLTSPVARLCSVTTGVTMCVYTDQTSIQFYAGQHLPRAWRGKSGASYGPQQGLCLETQHLPNSPNRADFPSTRLEAGETFQSTTIFRFSAEAGAPGA